jgi:predicted phage terminase large subunit-like protein
MAAPRKMLSQKDKELRELLELERLLLETSLYQFVLEAWKNVIKPTEPLLGDLWYVEAICLELEAVAKGEYLRLIINQPPRSLKSTITSVCFPVWLWIKQPSLEFVFSSYGLTSLTNKMSLDRRRLIESPWFQQRWANNFTLSVDENTKTRFSNDKRGAMQSASTDSGITGLGGDIIVIDDPHNVADIVSDAERTADNNYIRESLLTRLNNRNTGRVVLVMQRLHEDDATGMLLELGNWHHLCLQAQAEEASTIQVNGGKKYKIKKGQLLNKDLFGKKALAEAFVTLGSRGYAGQYQQRPAPQGGIIFNPLWWRTWTESGVNPLPQTFDQQIISVDCAFKDQSHNDFVSIQVWGFVGPRSYLIARDTQHRGYTSTKQGIRDMKAVHPGVNLVLVEDKANGSAVVEELKKEFNIIAIDPQGGKESRAQACSADMEAGNVYLPDKEAHAWVTKFITDFAKFPAAKHDDDVDACTQALNWRRGRRFGLLEYYKEEGEKLGAAKPATQEDNLGIMKNKMMENTRSQFREHGLTPSKVMSSDLGKIAVGPQTPKCRRCNNAILQRSRQEDREFVSCARCGLTEELPKPIVRPDEANAA